MNEMAKQVNKTVIGGFVISAIILLIVAVMVFGGGKFFKKTISFVMFFDRSVKGLKDGAPVIFRGVEIGTVENVIVRADTKKLEVDIPVVIEIEPERFHLIGERLSRDPYELAKLLIDRGLRCRLTLESLVTGQLMIEMDFFPDAEVRLEGIDVGYPELPTMPTELDEFAQKLQKLPLEEIFEKLLAVVESVEKTLSAPELMEIIRNLKTASANLTHLVDNTNNFVSHVEGQIDPLSTGLQATMGDARKLLKDVDGEVGALSTRIQDAMVSGKKALDQADRTLQTYKGLVDERSDMRKDIELALTEIALAARSLRALTDYLEQHPEALLQGKGE